MHIKRAAVGRRERHLAAGTRMHRLHSAPLLDTADMYVYVVEERGRFL